MQMLKGNYLSIYLQAIHSVIQPLLWHYITNEDHIFIAIAMAK